MRNSTNQMQTSLLVSIVVPAYNVGEHIGKCLQSLAEQDYTNIEVLVVDDSSSDNTFAIASDFAAKDLRFRAIHMTQNSGAGETRWRGITLSKGRYIGFLDADDWAVPHFVSSLVRVMSETDCDVACCQHFYFYPDGRMTTPWPYDSQYLMIDRQEAVRRMCNYDRIGTELWNKMFKRELLVNRPMASMEFEDAFYLINVMRDVKNVCIYTVPLVYYVQREGSLMNSPYSIEKEISHCELKVYQGVLYNDVGLKADRQIIKHCIKTFKNVLLVSDANTQKDLEEKVVALLAITRNLHYKRRPKWKYSLLREFILNFREFYSWCYTRTMKRFHPNRILQLRNFYKKTSADVCQGK